MAGISIREFARRDGCSEGTVRKALKAGRLAALADGTLDPELIGIWGAARSWDAYHSTQRGTHPRPLLGLPVVVRRHEHPGGAQTFVGLIARTRRDGSVDIVALPFGGSPLSLERVPLLDGPPEDERTLAAWLAG